MITRQNENTTSYTYNEFELVSKEIYPNELETQFFYDDNERLTQVVQEDGSEINYTYNLAGELEVLSGSDFIKEFERDKDSLVTLAQNQDAATQMSYDEFSRLERVDDPTTQIRLEYSYNERGERSQMRISRRGAQLSLIEYTYSKTGKLKTLDASVLNQSITWQRSFDERDLPTQDLLSNSQRVVYDFDAAQRLTLLENLNPEDKVISSFGYSYSPRGNITQIELAQGGYGSLEPGTTQLDFSYDETGQLVSSTLDPEGLPNLDLLGNPTGMGYQTNSLNQLLETPRYQLKYDLRGNLIEKINKISGKLISFEWNTENKLVRAQIYDNTDTLISELAYRYDALDRRVFKKLTHHQKPDLSYTRHYVYDGEDLIMELNADQNPIAFYVHAEGVDNPIAMLRDLNNSGSLEDEEVFFFTKDHLGSIREITNLRGEVLQRYDYKSYGEAKITKNDRLRDRLLENAFAFTGREVEIELGIYYYRARYYEPTSGRFIQQDPIGLAGEDTNLYRYVLNNPVNLTDPTGNCPWCIAAAVGGLVSGGIDLGTQLLSNGGNFSRVDWGSVGSSTLVGAATSALMPTGFLLGRSGQTAARFGYGNGGVLNRSFVRFGWSNKNKVRDVLSLRIGRTHFDVPGISLSAGAQPVRDGVISGALGSLNNTSGGQNVCSAQ